MMGAIAKESLRRVLGFWLAKGQRQGETRTKKNKTRPKRDTRRPRRTEPEQNRNRRAAGRAAGGRRA